jgi:hypothetical protein
MKTLPPTHCPKCKQPTVDKSARRCRNLDCLTPLLFQGDDGHANQDEEYYVYMRGMYGLGWYQRAILESRPMPLQ